MTDVVSRRSLLAAAVAGAGALVLAPAARALGTSGTLGTTTVPVDPWTLLPAVLKRIVPPTFPARDVAVTTYGGMGDGTTDCTEAFRRAIAACADAGGGRVVVPAGRFLTGPIHLRSLVNLHVSKGGTIAFTQDPARYLPAVLTRFEGTELMGYSPLIYALDQHDIAVTGEGTLDGQAGPEHWWPWKGNSQGGYKVGGPTQKPARDRLVDMAERGVPVAQRVFGTGDYLRPQFIQPYRCKNILIEGVTIVNSPMWEIHPVLCTNVTVRGVSIASHGPNNDGCDPESCRDVLIEHCTFDTGDDCIAIKSGRNADGRRLHAPSEYIVVRDCVMKDGHGGVTVGSEISGDCRWVFAERNRMDSPNLDRALRLKNNAARGGVLEHIYMRDSTVGQVADAVLSIDLYYEEGQNGPYTPIVRDVEMRTVTSRKSNYGLYMRAYPKSEISDVRVVECRFDGVAKGNVTEGVQRLVMRDVRVNGELAKA